MTTHLGLKGNVLGLGPLGLDVGEPLDVRELVERERVLSEFRLVEDSEGVGGLVSGRMKEEEEST
jgi:hypothetical protein